MQSEAKGACFVLRTGSDASGAETAAKAAQGLGFRARFVGSLIDLRVDPAYRSTSTPLVIVPDNVSDGSLAESAAEFAQAEFNHAYTIYVSDRIEASTYKRLVRSGAAEWIRWEALSLELAELVRSRHHAASPERAARILTCWPSKGGVGNTLLATEIAVQLAAKRKRGGQRVAALELNLQGGTLADSLNLQPRFDLQAFIRNPERLDGQLIDVFASAVSPRLDVFATPPRRLPTEALKAEVVFGFLDAISARYDVIVLDLPTIWQPWIDNILEGSDAIVLSGGSTVPAVKRMMTRLEQLDALAVDPSKIAVAVNQCGTDLLGRIDRRSEIDKALPGRRVFYIRRDAAAVDEALDSGRPLTESAPGSKVVKTIRSLTDWTESVSARTAVQPSPDPAAVGAQR